MNGISKKQAQEFLSDQLRGSLSDHNEKELMLYEEQNAEFKSEADEIRKQWSFLVAEPLVKVPGEMDRKFYRMMRDAELAAVRPRRESRWILGGYHVNKWVVQGITMIAVLLTGIFIGNQFPAESVELAKLQDDVAYLERVVVLTMLEDASANKRFAAVERSGQRAGSDPALQTALLRTLQHDPNVNVRMAALNVLASGYALNADVREKVWNAATDQNSPLVTATAVELWRASPDQHTRRALEDLLQHSPDAVFEPQLRRAIESLDN